MIAALWFCFETFSNILDQFLFLYLVDHQLPEKQPKRFSKVVALFVFTGVLTTLQQLKLPYVITFSGMFLFHLTYCLVFRQGTVFQRIQWPVIARTAFFGLNQATAAFFSVIPDLDYQASLEQTPQRFLGVCFYMFLTTIVFYLLSRIGWRERSLPSNTQLASVIMAVICVIFTGVIFDLSPAAMEHEPSAWVVNIACAGFMIASAAWLFIQDKLATQSAEHYALQMKLQRLESEQKYNDALLVASDNLRDANHDFRNHLLALAGLVECGDIQGIRDYLARLQVKISPDEFPIFTNYPQLNAVISSKLQQAAALDIKTKIQLVMPNSLPMCVVDFCSIIGNILDNAIEAAQQVSGEKRYLRLQTGLAGAMWQIHLENGCNGKYKRDEDMLLTTKKEAWHGIGLKLVRQFAEQSGGYLVLDPGAESFVVDIFLPWEVEEAASVVR